MITDPITTDGEGPAEMSVYAGGDPDTDPHGDCYHDSAPPPVPLDDDERRMLAEWEGVLGQ